MEELKNFSINGISMSVIQENSDGIVLRIYSATKKITTSLEGTRYISYENGILELDAIEPLHMKYASMGETILADSFIDVTMSFNRLRSVNNKDRINLHLKNIANVIIQRNDNTWHVVEYSTEESLEDYINQRIEHFDAIEEKIGISIQNCSVKISNGKYIHPYCEVLSLSNQEIPDFAIEVAIYDKQNRIIGFSHIDRDGNDFLGFEVFSFNVDIDCPVSDIGRVVFYPIK